MTSDRCPPLVVGGGLRDLSKLFNSHMEWVGAKGIRGYRREQKGKRRGGVCSIDGESGGVAVAVASRSRLLLRWLTIDVSHSEPQHHRSARSL